MSRTTEPLPLLNAADFAASLSDRAARAMLHNGATEPIAGFDNCNVITLQNTNPDGMTGAAVPARAAAHSALKRSQGIAPENYDGVNKGADGPGGAGA
ncbi:hypothetical protein [Roseibium sp. RKSG952]|uniref:hypothetical protein n=1 Tax=Roseibium sp. RKSG952 TaxID=2529384 RepID=UPI0012BC9B8D|nr:hypothetical protein [Roseibium sp. RKSG952]MTH97304.1 hypothetical protein [Roseibium sp. RKSG952]